MTDLDLLEARLQADASAILDRARKSQRFLVFDIEYQYDRDGQRRADRHAADPRRAGSNHSDDRAGSANEKGKPEVKWPFHRIGCISAMTLAVEPAGGIDVETLETWSRPEMTEADVVRGFATFVEGSGEAMPVTWGGEFKDIPALLAIAMREGFALPASLSDGHWTRARLDLCDQLRSKAKPPHLNEYAHAQGLPAKLMAPWELGEAAERGKWTAIREHCEGDVTVTAMLLARWLLATGVIRAERAAIDTRIVTAVATARPYRPALLRALAGFTSVPLAVAA
ncbi:MAG: 3'-5' exonuclease [Erythrobacter sp.]|nr:3'-5' exonuclease [Erythrobacter sp.]